MGFSTSEFGLPCGFGSLSQACAVAEGTLKAPARHKPKYDHPAFFLSGIALVRSLPPLPPAVRSAWMFGTGYPSSTTDWIPACAGMTETPKHTSDTRTAAPSLIHSSSLHALKIFPLSRMRSSTGRLRFCRMELVATKPARWHLP